MEELVSEALPILESVLVEPLMLFPVRVAVAALLVMVSVPGGSVSVPPPVAGDAIVTVPEVAPANPTLPAAEPGVPRLIAAGKEYVVAPV